MARVFNVYDREPAALFVQCTETKYFASTRWLKRIKVLQSLSKLLSLLLYLWATFLSDSIVEESRFVEDSVTKSGYKAFTTVNILKCELFWTRFISRFWVRTNL